MKITLEHIQKYLELEDYKLLSKEYINAKTKLNIRCPEGHIYKVIWNSFQQGRRCPICSPLKVANKLKYNYSYVKEEIEKEEYKLISDEYINQRTKLKIECPKGHVFLMDIGHFKRGQRCPYCAGKHITYEQIKRDIEMEGYTLLSKEYTNAKTKLTIRCPSGHEYKVNRNNFKSGNRCPYCAERIKLEYGYIKEQIEKEGYKLLSKKYENNKSKLYIECPEGHRYYASYGKFKGGNRCPICCNLISKPEKEVLLTVYKFIDPSKVIENDITQILNPTSHRNLELDIWIPSLKKAIEFNGDYWHSKKQVIQRDKIKSEQCKKKGIDLLVIKENSWNNQKDKCRKRIREHLI